MTGNALINYIQTNQDKLNYEAFVNENHGISQATQNQ